MKSAWRTCRDWAANPWKLPRTPSKLTYQHAQLKMVFLSTVRVWKDLGSTVSISKIKEPPSRQAFELRLRKGLWQSGPTTPWKRTWTVQDLSPFETTPPLECQISTRRIKFRATTNRVVSELTTHRSREALYLAQETRAQPEGQSKSGLKTRWPTTWRRQRP